MAISFPSVRMLTVLGLVAIPGAAWAQFGSIFQPPRPPADIGGPSQPAPPPYGGLPQMPPEEMDEDAPPPPPQRAPSASRQPQYQPPPYQQGPGQGVVRSQPLPPPPGTPQQGTQQGTLAPGQTLPPVQESPAGSQQARGTPPATNVAPQPGDEVITELPSQKISNPTAVFTGLDKVTGRIITFDVALNETVQFGALQVTPRVCYTRPPTESANTDSFVEVDEVTLQGEVKRIFTGWMFASSPGLHAVEHPIYDVWLTNCKGGTTVVADTPPPPAGTPSPPQRQQRGQPRQGVQQPTLQQPGQLRR